MPPARLAFLALTLAAIAFAGRAIFVHRAPVGVAAAFIAVYVAAVLCGVFFLRLRVFVDATVRGPRGAKGVALTFDDGPDPEWTPRALDALDAAGATATFFVIGKKAEAHPELVRAIVERGHAVGLHSYAHDRLFAMRGPETWRRDLRRAQRVVKEITGKRTTLFRPPIGHTTPHVPRVLRELKLRVIGWSVGARDGIAADPKAVAARVIARARDGAIVLLHDAAERGDHDPAGVLALPEILRGLKDKGLEVVPLGEWIG